MKRSRAELALAALILTLASGCATAPSTPITDAATAPTRGNRNVITAAELAASTHANALELIYAVRPQWLSHRGQESISLGQGVDVYVDGLRQERAILAQLPPTQLERLEFLSPTEATFRYGVQEGSGAIVVTTRRR